MEALYRDEKFMSDLRLGKVHTNYFAKAMESKITTNVFSSSKASYNACRKSIDLFMEKFFGKENIDWRIEKGKDKKGATTDFYIVINEKTT
jgi:hypothetical protein